MYENYASQQPQNQQDLPHQQQHQQYIQQPYQISQYPQPQVPPVDPSQYQQQPAHPYYFQYSGYNYPQLPPPNIQNQPPNPNQQYYQYPSQLQILPQNQQFQPSIHPPLPPPPNVVSQYQIPPPQQPQPQYIQQHRQPLVPPPPPQQQQYSHPHPHQQATKIPTIMPTFSKNSFLHTGEFRFVLEVAQHPVRARMCGFGDKDRRQITPPPCIRLRIYNIHTDVEFTDISTIDTSFYALLVELWSVDMTTNMSLVHPSGQIYHPQSHKKHGSSSSHRSVGSSSSRASSETSRQSQLPQTQYQSYYPNVSSSYYKSSSGSSGSSSNSSPPTRNLIGSLVATAHKLHDLNDEQGVWFILQDLSVRTEGEFRLKFSFVNLADAVIFEKPTTSSTSSSSSVPASSSNIPNSAPIITSVFSNPFRSYSAKKFPGVIDSTDLSRCFANQGIKIPIRREQKSKEKKNT